MASDKTLKQAISNITIWRKGEQRAPHKPLLLLHVLSHYRQGHDRLFNYGSEIYEPLLDLLERYGPQRRDQRPDMPFWRLKGDGFWELQNAELCSTKGSRQPPRRELIEYNVEGGFDADNFALVAKNHRLIDTLAQQLLEAHFPVSIQEDIADEMGFDIRTSLRQRDPKFRQMVLRAYNYQCAICGFNMRHDNAPIALEAAHIRWKQNHGPCEVPNGLALCAIHHKAFDRGSIGLDENMRVIVSDAVNGGGVVQRLFWDFAGKAIALPPVKENYPGERFVEWHRKEVFRGEH
ncbi:TPA: HNH endonuclease [Salmonella enterica subsp. enterica serovar Aberdeen]|uniref:HNH endonuclease n=5 Tax=Salmonella enterica TaxID=28901 RepID=A0A5T5V6Z5_SALER|nr:MULTISPECIES: HNH endonuclease [Salmonella]EAA2688905.1 HNH endonuclease [Salmonella enterica subsp. enterica serovar Umbilo]EAA3202001.1 HNH endonuclease [Salmonella enterica subsp. enterica serovar Aberdeen]EAA5344031.1 HNH endonuclease [Salmonella enterica subsp. enterica serovar Thompson]EAA8423282.1 HNH endonuclease [Salmonella enterica subsp. enterica]EAA9529768.1 HNH endonuclease [Salmonella enterica subsp. enterica serovar Vitkin]EAO1509219.1 HNH endonuclease [Salmonella enterica s